jgi:hypothetical protein
MESARRVGTTHAIMHTAAMSGRINGERGELGRSAQRPARFDVETGVERLTLRLSRPYFAA